MSDFYQLNNSTSDFKSRSNDVFDKLVNLEKQHSEHVKVNAPLRVQDEEASTRNQNPTIPIHAITFRKRPMDDKFTRPVDKWTKYTLDDVNEHHLSDRANHHALNDFLRTHAKAPDKSETDEIEPERPIFERPMKKQKLTNDDDDDKKDHFISVRVPVPSHTKQDDADEEDEPIQYKLKSSRAKPRGVSSSNQKASTKLSIDLLQDKDDEDQEEEKNDEDDTNDEFFEP